MSSSRAKGLKPKLWTYNKRMNEWIQSERATQEKCISSTERIEFEIKKYSVSVSMGLK